MPEERHGAVRGLYLRADIGRALLRIDRETGMPVGENPSEYQFLPIGVSAYTPFFSVDGPVEVLLAVVVSAAKEWSDGNMEVARSILEDLGEALRNVDMQVRPLSDEEGGP